MHLIKTTWLLALATVLGFTAPAAPREETVFLFENRKVTLAIPAGLAYNTGKDYRGLVTVRLADPDEKVSFSLTFIPDPEKQFENARARKEKMVEIFEEHVGNSTEKAMQFEELEPKFGVGTYCVFTDARLAGKKRPPGEFLHSTIGLKAWPGVVAIFELLSQDTSSGEYQSILRMLRESVQERAAPLK